MAVLKIILLVVALLSIALLGMGVKILVQRNGQFSGGSCSNYSPEMKDKGITCGCGNEGACESDKPQGVPLTISQWKG